MTVPLDLDEEDAQKFSWDAPQARTLVIHQRTTAPGPKSSFVDLYDAASAKAATTSHTSAMVALVPPSDVARQIAIPNGEPADELHVTLAFLGDAASVPDPAALQSALAAFAQTHQPIDAVLAGRIVMPQDPMTNLSAYCVNVDAPALPEFRQAVLRLLRAAHVVPVENHGFTPHLTLRYLNPTEEEIRWTGSSQVMTFSTLRLALGTEVHDFTLGSAEPPTTTKQVTPSSAVTPADLTAARELISQYAPLPPATTTPTPIRPDVRHLRIIARRAKRLHVQAQKAGGGQALADWYTSGADGQIDWGSEGDFDQCVSVASDYMDEDQAAGYCNERHQDAVGGAPGTEDGS